MQSKKEARCYAYQLICDGKDDITKLDEEEKEILSAYIIDSYDKFKAYEFIGEPSESNEYAYLLSKYMKTKDWNDASELLDMMVKAAVKYAGNEIVDLLIEQDQEYKFDMKYDKGA